jgi:hypothetical protein
MRKFIFMMLAVLGFASISTPASAQSIDTIVGVINGVSAFGYNSCSYVRGGIQKSACQANRISNVLLNARQVQDRARWNHSIEYDRKAFQLEALQKACRAGDSFSCQRTGGMDDNQMVIARALISACRNGDRISCGRADSIMSGHEVAVTSRPASTIRTMAPAVRVQPASTAMNFEIINGKRCVAVSGGYKCFD